MKKEKRIKPDVKRAAKRIAMLCLAVLLAASLLTSCRSSGVKVKADEKGLYEKNSYTIKSEYPKDEQSLD